MLVDSSSIDVLRYLDRLQPAEVRTADDIVAPLTLPHIAYVSGSAENEPERFSVETSPWLLDAMEVISVQRDRLSKETESGRLAFALLDDAEMLAALFAGSDSRRRPQLNILPDGRPSFATSTMDCYLHVTVDEPKRITWYALIDGREYFHENIPFDGRRLPDELRRLVSV
jgi:hypothetical protein